MRFMARDEIAPRRLHQQRAEGLRARAWTWAAQAHQGLHLLQAQVHLLRDLPVGEDRLRALHHDLPPARAAPRAALPPDLSLVRALVQRRIPPRRELRADHARQPAPAARRQQAVDPLLPAGGLRHHVRARPHAARAARGDGPGRRPSTTTRCSASRRRSRRQVFPLSLDIDNPAFRAGLERLCELSANDGRGQGARRPVGQGCSRPAARWRPSAPSRGCTCCRRERTSCRRHAHGAGLVTRAGPRTSPGSPHDDGRPGAAGALRAVRVVVQHRRDAATWTACRRAPSRARCMRHGAARRRARGPGAHPRRQASVAGAYCAFTCALLVWGWQEIAFLLGCVTGPRRSACPHGATGWRRTRLRGPGRCCTTSSR